MVRSSLARKLIFLLSTSASGLDNGMALTPALGYNSWNHLECHNLNAANIKKAADALAALNARLPHPAAHKYQYVNIDDCWATTRSTTPPYPQRVDPLRFPDGMQAVSDYVHSKNLLLGIYTDRGTKTCAGRPGSKNFEQVDAALFAQWKVDYVKEDSCYASTNHSVAFHDHGLFRDALNATGRRIYFSLCGWSSWYAPVGAELGNSWRVSGDVQNWSDVYKAVRINENLYPYAHTGAWNDPDMLVGSSEGSAMQMTPWQARTQFALWAMMHAPLLIGANIITLSPWDVETFTNEKVIAIDQDPLGKQGRVLWQNCPDQPDFTSDSFSSSRRTDNWRTTWYATLRAVTCFFKKLLKGDEVCADASAVPNCQQVWGKPLKSSDNKTFALMMVNFGPLRAREVVCDQQCVLKLQDFFGLNVGAAFVAEDLWSGKKHAWGDIALHGIPVQDLQADGGSVIFRLTKAPRAMIFE